MRFFVASVLLSTSIVSAVSAAIPTAPAGFDSDDVVTLLYDPALGYFSVDNPAGNDAAVGAITTFELVSSEPFFTGPRPPEFNGLFDVWSPTKAFRLDTSGFFDMQWPAGTVESGADPHNILTLSGSFLSGGPLEPVDLCVCTLPEPSSIVLFGLGAFCLTATCRRRN